MVVAAAGDKARESGRKIGRHFYSGAAGVSIFRIGGFLVLEDKFYSTSYPRSNLLFLEAAK